MGKGRAGRVTVQGPYRAQPVRHAAQPSTERKLAAIEWVPPAHERHVSTARSSSEAASQRDVHRPFERNRVPQEER